MKKISLYVLILITCVQCQKENEDCHYDIIIKNNSNKEVIFTGANILLDKTLCSLGKGERISPNNSYKYNYSLWDCIELILKTETLPLYIIEPNNYTTEAVPCEEFEERNTILRTYILTLEDLERLNYTINYPEDVSIGVD